MTMIWLAILMILIVMIVSLRLLNKRLESKTDNLETCLAKLSEVVGELRESDVSSKDLLGETVKNITQYNPFGEG